MKLMFTHTSVVFLLDLYRVVIVYLNYLRVAFITMPWSELTGFLLRWKSDI